MANFEIILFLGTGQWARTRADTIEGAQAEAVRLKDENASSRLPLIYEIDADGRATLVTAKIRSPFRVIQMVEGHMIRSDIEPHNFYAWCSARGLEPIGINSNPRHRDELQGQPKFQNLCGPMWDGDAVRYEDSKSNESLSR